MLNYLETVISQYGNSPVMLAILENLNTSIDPTADIEAFYSMVVDLGSAQGFGLNYWGTIVGVERLVYIPETPESFGFSQGPSGSPFGQEPFYTAQTEGAYTLSDPAFLALILMKGMSNISDGSVKSYNAILNFTYSAQGRAYCLDFGDMQIQQTFEFALLPYQLALLLYSGALARPAGVSMTVLQVDVPGTLGFDEAGMYQPFDYGVFGQNPQQVT